MPSKTLLLILLSCALMVVLHVRLDENIHADIWQQRHLAMLPSVESVQLLSGGMDKLAADIYWLQFVQYCGEATNDRGDSFDRSYDYVNLITGLDPQFTKPYWFGCWAIGYWQKRPDLADKILQRGIAANPTAWDLAYLAGVNQYLFAKNYKLAAHYYRVASTKPGAPDFLSRHAKILESDMPELTKRFQTLWSMYWRTQDVNLKESLFKELIPVMKSQRQEAPTPMNKNEIQKSIDRLTDDYNKTVAQ